MGATGSVSIEIEQVLGRAEKAFLFDLDGTLVDTMPLHFAAYAEVFAERGLRLEQSVYMSLIGAPARQAIPRFLAACGEANTTEQDVSLIHGQKKDSFDRILKKQAPIRLPAADLLDRAQGRKRCALVSSGNRRGVEAIINRMGWDGRFEAVITGDDVIAGKPSPEPFESAARALGYYPADCLAFEDTADGMASARAAGMEVVDVTGVTFT